MAVILPSKLPRQTKAELAARAPTSGGHTRRWESSETLPPAVGRGKADTRRSNAGNSNLPVWSGRGLVFPTEDCLMPYATEEHVPAVKQLHHGPITRLFCHLI